MPVSRPANLNKIGPQRPQGYGKRPERKYFSSLWSNEDGINRIAPLRLLLISRSSPSLVPSLSSQYADSSSIWCTEAWNNGREPRQKAECQIHRLMLLFQDIFGSWTFSSLVALWSNSPLIHRCFTSRRLCFQHTPGHPKFHYFWPSVRHSGSLHPNWRCRIGSVDSSCGRARITFSGKTKMAQMDIGEEYRRKVSVGILWLNLVGSYSARVCWVRDPKNWSP